MKMQTIWILESIEGGARSELIILCAGIILTINYRFLILQA